MRIDLQCPLECFRRHPSARRGDGLSAEAGLDVVALTDHDSTDGWAEAAVSAREHGVALVPGMEISCRTSEGISVHLLCYLQDPAHPGLLEEITKAKDARFTRAERIVSLLAEDYPLSWTTSSTTCPGRHPGPAAHCRRPGRRGRGRGPQ